MTLPIHGASGLYQRLLNMVLVASMLEVQYYEDRYRGSLIICTEVRCVGAFRRAVKEPDGSVKNG